MLFKIIAQLNYENEQLEFKKFHFKFNIINL